MPDADLLKRLATVPIPGDKPCGESIRYDEAYSLLDAEIAKLENPAGGEVDWRSVETSTADLLATRSKDVLLAAWLVRALWQREGFAGLAAGLAALRELMATFWETMHPDRIRARRAALEWLGEKLAACIDDGQLAGDAAGAAACRSEVESIVAWSDGRFEGADCGLLSLLSRLRSAPQPATGATPAADGAPAATAPAGPIANRQQAVVRLRELADWWSKHEPSSPMVPLLNRAVTWSDLDFQAVFSLLLRGKAEAKDYMWDVLGINDGVQANEAQP